MPMSRSPICEAVSEPVAMSAPVSVPSTTSSPMKLCTSKVLSDPSLMSAEPISLLPMSTDLTSPSTMSVLRTVLTA